MLDEVHGLVGGLVGERHDVVQARPRVRNVPVSEVGNPEFVAELEHGVVQRFRQHPQLARHVVGALVLDRFQRGVERLGVVLQHRVVEPLQHRTVEVRQGYVGWHVGHPAAAWAARVWRILSSFSFRIWAVKGLMT